MVMFDPLGGGDRAMFIQTTASASSHLGSPVESRIRFSGFGVGSQVILTDTSSLRTTLGVARI